MKKAPKRFRKRYEDGTPMAGVQELDEKGQPIINRKAQMKEGATNALGQFGQAYYSSQVPENEGDAVYNQGMGAVAGLGGIGKTISGLGAIGDAIGKPIRKKAEVTNEQNGQYKDIDKASNAARVGALVNPFKSLTSVLSDKNSSNFQKGVAVATGGAGNSLFMKDYYKSKERGRIDEINKQEIEKEKIANAGNLQEALAARDRGDVGYNVQNKYTRDPNTIAYNKGGTIKGKGTGTSDSINAEVEEGSFVVPTHLAGTAKMIKSALLKKKTGIAKLHQKGGVPVKLSNGEILFTPDEKKEIEEEMGEEILKMLAPDANENEEGKKDGGELSAEKAKTILKDNQANGQPLTDKQKRYFGWIAGGSEMANGGGVNDEDNPTKISSKKQSNAEINTPKKIYKKSKTNNYSRSYEREPVPTSLDNYYKGLGNEEIIDASAEINNPNSNAVDTNPVSTKPSETKQVSSKSNFWDKVNGANLDGLGSTIANYGLAAYQIKEGRKGLKGTRPVNTIDPTFLDNVNTAQKNAKFGFTPEQDFMLKQENQNLLTSDRFNARNFSGGSGGNAYNMERNASNNAFSRSLQNASANTELQQSKQGFAAQLAAQKDARSRQIFEDSLNAFNAKQSSAGQTLNAGIGNVFDANRFANFMRLRNKENEFNSKYNP